MQTNGWFTFVLVTVLALAALDAVAAWLNLRALSPRPPEGFADVVDAESHARSRDYTRVSTRHHLLEGAVSLALFLGFWWLGGFEWLDRLVRGWGHGPIVTGVLFTGILFLANHVAGLPFDLYDTFSIEERFGFNKTTPAVYVTDQVKTLLLTAVLGVPLLALLLWIFGRLPHAWLWGWGAVTALSLMLAYVAPTWILPLFYKFEPLADGELKTAIEAMSEKCEFPLREVVVMDGSKRSTKSNAFFTGFGRNKRIALFDTLIENHSTDELVGVLAHEIGHYKRRHVIKGMVLGFLTTGGLFFLLGRIVNDRGVFDAFGVRETSVYLSLVFFAILAQPLNRLLNVASNAWSRRWEFEADAFAAETTGRPEAMATALKKLSKDNLSNLTPHPFHVFLNHTHPPVAKRIERLVGKGEG